MDSALIFGTIIFLILMPMVIAVWAVTFLKNNPPRDVLEAQKAEDEITDETEAA